MMLSARSEKWIFHHFFHFTYFVSTNKITRDGKPGARFTNTCSQNRQSIKFQNHENINFVEKLYFFIL